MTEEQLDHSGQSYKYKREVRALETHPDKGGDAEEFRRVYVLKKMFDKWSEAVLEVVPAVAPSLIGPVRGFMKARRTRPWLSEAAGATDEEAIAATHGEKEEPMTEEWSRTPRP